MKTKLIQASHYLILLVCTARKLKQIAILIAKSASILK